MYAGYFEGYVINFITLNFFPQKFSSFAIYMKAIINQKQTIINSTIYVINANELKLLTSAFIKNQVPNITSPIKPQYNMYIRR